jgi:hypothetical protein
MTTEEKAKAYDEAIERANSLLSGNQLGNAWIYKLFPELKKSEDEIFKELLYNLIISNDYTSSSKEIFSIYGKTKEDCIAWIEKRGEKTEPIEGFNTEFERQISHLIASIINKEYAYTEEFVKWTSNALLNYAKKQDVQNPAWSEEDDETLNSILNDLSQGVIPDDEDMQWLKSFKERFSQPNWKPSKEQMDALDKAKNSPANYYDIRLGLQSLYNDLKKL